MMITIIIIIIIVMIIILSLDSCIYVVLYHVYNGLFIGWNKLFAEETGHATTTTITTTTDDNNNNNNK